MWKRCVRCLLGGLAAGIFAVTIFCASLLKDPFFLSSTAIGEGAETIAYEYYLYDKSSCASIRSELSFFDLPAVRGESVSLHFQTEGDAVAYMDALLTRSGASVVEIESSGGAESVYAYAAGYGEGLRLFDACVNLQIARRGAFVCVGSPIIFGGY